MKKLLLLFCLFLYSYSNETVVNKDNEEKITLISSLTQELPTIKFDYIQTLDKGIKRDFFINEFLQQDISSNDAFKTLLLIDNMNDEMFHNFAKKFAHDETYAVSQCMKMNKNDLINSYADCIAVGLSLEEMSRLSSLDLDLVKQKLGNKYPILSKYLKVISSSIPFTKIITLKKDQFYELYFGVSKEFRTKYFNYKLPKRTFQKIFVDKKRFDEFLDITLRNKDLRLINKSLLNLDDKELSFNSSFLLALNAIEFNDLNTAYKYFKNSLSKSSSSQEFEKINFWLYKITKNEEYKKNVLENNSTNIYSILLKEELKNKKPNGSIEKNDELESFVSSFKPQKKAFFYTLAKNKSSFNKDKISKDFDLGMMQLNISLFKSIKNNMTEEKIIDIKKLFSLEENLSLSSIYIDTIFKSYENPILRLLAYENKSEAINGLKTYENKELAPMLTFELLLKENEFYIKELISTYYLYINSFLEDKKEYISLSSIFQNLITPSQTLSEQK